MERGPGLFGQRRLPHFTDAPDFSNRTVVAELLRLVRWTPPRSID
jgi:hypothetical protein